MDKETDCEGDEEIVAVGNKYSPKTAPEIVPALDLGLAAKFLNLLSLRLER